MRYFTPGCVSRADCCFRSFGDIVVFGSRALIVVNLRGRWGISREGSGKLRWGMQVSSMRS